MAVELTGTIKYARHMKGENGGKEYDFFSFVVLDNDEGVRWPLQVQGDHPQFADLCQHENELMDRQVRVIIRAFSAGYRKVTENARREGNHKRGSMPSRCRCSCACCYSYCGRAWPLGCLSTNSVFKHVRFLVEGGGWYASRNTDVPDWQRLRDRPGRAAGAWADCSSRALPMDGSMVVGHSSVVAFLRGFFFEVLTYVTARQAYILGRKQHWFGTVLMALVSLVAIYVSAVNNLTWVAAGHDLGGLLRHAWADHGQWPARPGL